MFILDMPKIIFAGSKSRSQKPFMGNSIEKKITTLLRQFAYYTMLYDNHKIATSEFKSAMQITFEVLMDTIKLPDELKFDLKSILKKEALLKIKEITKSLDRSYQLIEETFQKYIHSDLKELETQITRRKSLIIPEGALPDPQTLLVFCAIRIKELIRTCENHKEEQFLRDEMDAKVKLIILHKLGLINTLKCKVKTDDKVAEILFKLTSIPPQYSSKLISPFIELDSLKTHVFTNQSLNKAAEFLKRYNFTEEAESLVMAKAKSPEKSKKK